MISRIRRADAGHSMVVSLISFGFKYGQPYGADLVFDVRFLPNPHFVPGLRERTGQEEPVQIILTTSPISAPCSVCRTSSCYLLPRYRRENRRYLSIAVGCTGGRHRSVAVAERLAAASTARAGASGSSIETSSAEGRDARHSDRDSRSPRSRLPGDGETILGRELQNVRALSLEWTEGWDEEERRSPPRSRRSPLAPKASWY